MSHANKNAIERRRQKARLDEDSFIRARLFNQDRSAFSRYADLALRSFSWPKLIRYELLMLFIGPMPGALGLALRKWLFPSLFRKSGKGVIFGTNLTLRHTDRVTLGDGVAIDRDSLVDARGAGEIGIVIGDRVIISSGAAIQAKVGHIEIGSDCNIGSRAVIVAQGPIIIEDNVSIAGNAMIAGGRYAIALDGARARPRFTSGAIRIGRNAKIGMGAIVQDGVTIGENAIVAPGSVVFENVAADAVVWGNPARPVRGHREGADPPGLASSKAGGARPERRIRERVRDYLREDLFIEFGPGGYDDNDSLVAANVLDSLALVRLALWVEQQFGIEMDLGGVSLSEIDSVEQIAGYLETRLPG